MRKISGRPLHPHTTAMTGPAPAISRIAMVSRPAHGRTGTERHGAGDSVWARKRAGSAQDEGTNLGVVPARDRSVRSRVAVFQGVAVCNTARSALSRSAGHHVYVGLAGLEPATSCTQSTRASQAALQPVPPEDSRHVSGSFYGKEVTGGHKPHTCYASKLRCSSCVKPV